MLELRLMKLKMILLDMKLLCKLHGLKIFFIFFVHPKLSLLLSFIEKKAWLRKMLE